MARIGRSPQIIFGSTGLVGTGGFGAAAVGNTATGAATGTTLATLMGTAAWPAGWLPATLGASKFPAVEDMNAFNYTVTTQLAYLLQEGIPAYDSATTYFIDNIVKNPGTFQLYGSLTNSNVGNALSSTVNWRFLCDLSAIGASGTQSVTGTNRTYAAADSGLLTLRSNSGSAMIDTIPGTGVGVMAKGWKTTIVNSDSSALLYVSVAAGAQFNGVSSGSVLLGPGQRFTLFSDGANYWSTDLSNRTKLGANTTIFVSPSGNDANAGITSGTAFLTLSKAAAFIQNAIDTGGFNISTTVADGTYTAGLIMTSPVVGGGVVTFTGNTTTPANCVISVTNANAVQATNGANYTIAGFKLQTTTSGRGIVCQANSNIISSGNIEFGSCVNEHVACGVNSNVSLNANYRITGGAPNHLKASNNGTIVAQGLTVTLVGTPNFASQFALADNGEIDVVSNTYSGAATGTRYLSQNNGVIQTSGAGATYLPGNAGGSVANGGQYV